MTSYSHSYNTLDELNEKIALHGRKRVLQLVIPYIVGDSMEKMIEYADERLHSKSPVRKLLIELFDANGDSHDLFKPIKKSVGGGGGGGGRKPKIREVSVNIYR